MILVKISMKGSIAMFFKNIEIDNFLSLGEDNKIKFNTDNITFIRGINLDTNGSNGAGKSTIIEALVWCLFGKTIRGVSADDVINFDARKNTRVSVEIDDYKISRHRKHSEHKNDLIIQKGDEILSLGSSRDSTKAIESIFNITYETFINSIVLGSNVNVNFLSAGSNSDRRKIFENLLDINNFSDFQKECKEKVATFDIDVAEIQTKINSTQEFLSNLKIKQEEAEANSLVFEEDRRRAIKELTIKKDQIKKIDIQSHIEKLNKRYELIQERTLVEEKIRSINESSSIVSQQVNSLNNKKQELDESKKYNFNEIKSSYSKIDSIKLKISEFEKLQYNIKDKISTLNSEISKLENDSKNTDKFIGKPCPTCGTLLDQDHLKEVANSFKDKIKDKNQEIEKQQKIVDASNKKISNLKEEIDSLTPEIPLSRAEVLEEKLKDYDLVCGELKTNQTSLDEFSSKLATLMTNNSMISDQIDEIKVEYEMDYLNELSDRIKNIDHEIKTKQEEKNPYKLINNDVEIKKYSKKIEDLQKELEEKEEEKKYWDFWKDAFGNKGLKIHIFDSVIPYFNSRIQFYLDILSAGKFKLEFDKDLSYSIEGTKYNNNSSGEKKRIDLAVMIALFDLLNLRTSSSSNILILDEVLDSLDEIGVESVQDLLIELNKRIKNIFIISHNNNLSENFPNVMNIVKNQGVSKIEY